MSDKQAPDIIYDMGKKAVISFDEEALISSYTYSKDTMVLKVNYYFPGWNKTFYSLVWLPVGLIVDKEIVSLEELGPCLKLHISETNLGGELHLLYSLSGNKGESFNNNVVLLMIGDKDGNVVNPYYKIRNDWSVLSPINLSNVSYTGPIEFLNYSKIKRGFFSPGNKLELVNALNVLLCDYEGFIYPKGTINFDGDEIFYPPDFFNQMKNESGFRNRILELTKDSNEVVSKLASKIHASLPVQKQKDILDVLIR